MFSPQSTLLCVSFYVLQQIDILLCVVMFAVYTNLFFYHNCHSSISQKHHGSIVRFTNVKEKQINNKLSGIDVRLLYDSTRKYSSAYIGHNYSTGVTILQPFFFVFSEEQVADLYSKRMKIDGQSVLNRANLIQNVKNTYFTIL